MAETKPIVIVKNTFLHVPPSVPNHRRSQSLPPRLPDTRRDDAVSIKSKEAKMSKKDSKSADGPAPAPTSVIMNGAKQEELDLFHAIRLSELYEESKGNAAPEGDDEEDALREAGSPMHQGSACPRTPQTRRQQGMLTSINDVNNVSGRKAPLIGGKPQIVVIPNTDGTFNHFVMDAMHERQLKCSDHRAYRSQTFTLPLGEEDPAVPFVLIVSPRQTFLAKGGSCFKKARGLCKIELKCLQSDFKQSTVTKVKLRFMVDRPIPYVVTVAASRTGIVANNMAGQAVSQVPFSANASLGKLRLAVQATCGIEKVVKLISHDGGVLGRDLDGVVIHPASELSEAGIKEAGAAARAFGPSVEEAVVSEWLEDLAKQQDRHPSAETEPLTHDFRERATAGLHQKEELWDFSRLVDSDSGRVMFSVEVQSLRSNGGKLEAQAPVNLALSQSM